MPALGLITAVETALAAQVSFETANKATADALVAKLAANVAPGTDTDLINPATSTYAQKIAAVVADAKDFRDAITAAGGDADTSVLVTRAATADSAVNTAFNALTSAQKTQANTYKTAIATEATAKAAQATPVEKAGVVASLAADGTAVAGFTAANGGTAPADLAAAAASLYTNYVNGTAAQRNAIDTQFKDSSFYATFKTSVVKDAAYADAVTALATAKDVLDTTTGTVTGSAAGDTYVNALKTKTDADVLVASAKAADADQASAKALADAYAVQTTAVKEAVAKLGGFSADGVSLHDTAVTAGALTFDATSANKDVFYFAPTTVATDLYAKAPLVGANDGSITGFAAGDSIVLGTGFTFNSGALSTGNGNALEFFLVQKGNDTLVVLETTAFGSSTTTNTATGAGAISSVDAAVITLTGVAASDLTVNNGIISHVA